MVGNEVYWWRGVLSGGRRLFCWERGTVRRCVEAWWLRKGSQWPSGGRVKSHLRPGVN